MAKQPQQDLLHILLYLAMQRLDLQQVMEFMLMEK